MFPIKVWYSKEISELLRKDCTQILYDHKSVSLKNNICKVSSDICVFVTNMSPVVQPPQTYAASVMHTFVFNLVFLLPRLKGKIILILNSREIFSTSKHANNFFFGCADIALCYMLQPEMIRFWIVNFRT